MRQRSFVLALVLLGAAAFGFLLTFSSDSSRQESPAGEQSTLAAPSPSGGAAGSAASVGPDAPADPARGPGAAPSGASAAAPAEAASTPQPAQSRPAQRQRTAPVQEDVSVTIDADVPNAQVFIDRQFIGNTPLTKFGIQPGRRQINVSAPGFDGYAETRDMGPGHYDIMVRLREVRLDASVAVVHDHEDGECSGTLQATQRGLRYETQGEDQFQARLTEIDELQVDYLAGRLRVRTGGREYVFAHDGAGADRLVQFQTDVNRARERLLAGQRPAR